jgi:hypothetical protein
MEREQAFVYTNKEAHSLLLEVVHEELRTRVASCSMFEYATDNKIRSKNILMFIREQPYEWCDYCGYFDVETCQSSGCRSYEIAEN